MQPDNLRFGRGIAKPSIENTQFFNVALTKSISNNARELPRNLTFIYEFIEQTVII